MGKDETMLHKCIVTTSWDDGHKLDIKLANMLQKYKIRGTFYIANKFLDTWGPLHPNELFHPISENEIVQLSKHFEIGAHTVTHPNLTTIPLAKAEKEIIRSKQILEKMLNKEICGFCYPLGAYNSEIAKIVKKAGYKYARTAKRFQTKVRDPFLMGTTTHVFPHNWIRNLKILWAGRPTLRGLHNWATRTKIMFDRVSRRGGIYHLWGHSWEIEKFKMWDELKGILEYVCNKKGVLYLTNHEVILSTSNDENSSNS